MENLGRTTENISDEMVPFISVYSSGKHLNVVESPTSPLVLLRGKDASESHFVGLENAKIPYIIKSLDEIELDLQIKKLIELKESIQKRQKANLVVNPIKKTLSSAHERFLKQIRDVIETQIDNHLFSVVDLGKAMAMSRSQVHRKLKAITDQPATRFVRNYRLNRAAELLLNEVGNITEIAYQVGFSSQTYFSSSFQELFGCSPSAYKERH